MLSHVYIGISDFDRALAFYAPLMGRLGLRQRFADAAEGWAAWQRPEATRPLFIIGRPFNGAPHQPGNGQMTALAAPDRATVDALYHAALAAGGRCEGPPGLRPHYHAHYYGAYFRDLDGNKLCVVCHAPDPAPATPLA